MALASAITFTLQAQELNYKVHAMFIYHFTKYIEWPQDASKKEFVIGVYGYSPIISELEELIESKRAISKNIVIKELNAKSELASCDIIFVPNSKTAKVPLIKEKIAGLPTLLITEKEGECKKESCVNFVVVDDKLKFEINKNNFAKTNLKISSELLKLGIVI